MTTATPAQPRSISPPLKTDDSVPAALNFAFPFKKSDGKDFIDEHQFHALLARESSGAYPVSNSAKWHGGIHVSDAGAGASLDLKHGVRCLADGEVVAYRVDRAYPVSELSASAGKSAVKAVYSTGFVLVRHTTEFPRGTKLTFFSLYMHLKSFEEYKKDASLKTPSYWSKVWKVTRFATDMPTPDAHRGKAVAGQIGMNIRAAAPSKIGGKPPVVGILPQGACVQIGARQGSWGRIVSIESGGPVIPASVGGFDDLRANTGWIFLGKSRGNQAMEPVLSESNFDQVVVLLKPVGINAGDLIGHLGRYDSLSEASTGTRMVHIEVFCDEKVKAYIEHGRAWVKKNADKIEPTILRIDRRVKLYAGVDREGADAPQTGVIQIYPLSALVQSPKEDQFEETTPGSDGSKFHWWKVNSANVRHAPISGWVREQNHAGGKVTRELACKWVDFEIHEEEHDPMHTMFANPKAYLDYWLNADEPDVPALAKLSPLAGKVYRSVFTTGSGANAADDLRKASRDPWRQLRLSRLIVKHESEWANPGKWKQLFEWIEQRTEHDPMHEEELKRIAKLVWWDTVAGKVEGFPKSADVFHIHPVGLVGNFLTSACSCGKDISLNQLMAILPADVIKNGMFYKASNSLIRGISLEKFLTLFNEKLNKYGIVECLHKAHFLSQLAHECDQLRTNEEYKNRDGSTPLGWNNYHGGANFHGRGLIQLTHNTNYARYGSAVANAQIESDPDIVASKIEHTIESACWYWRKGSNWGDINAISETGDFLKVTLAVNGGYNHVVERNKLLLKLAPLFKTNQCPRAKDVGMKGFKFKDSAVFRSKWYATHQPKVEQVEAQLAALQ